MISLEEKDLKRAKDKWLARAVQVAALLNEARAKLKKGEPSERKPTAPLPPNQSPWSSLDELDAWEAGERLMAVEDAADEAGLAADPIRRAREEGAQAALARRDRQDQEAREAFADYTSTARAPLMDLFDRYVAERKPAPATVKRWRPVMNHLIAHLGHDDVARITQKNIVAWKEALLAEKVAVAVPVNAQTTQYHPTIIGMPSAGVTCDTTQAVADGNGLPAMTGSTARTRRVDPGRYAFMPARPC